MHFNEVAAGAETLMKFVDRIEIVFNHCAALQNAILAVGHSAEEEIQLSWTEISMEGAVSDDPLDARFSLLANFCQLEKLIREWLPRQREGNA
eukprot:s607_g2.t1